MQKILEANLSYESLYRLALAVGSSNNPKTNCADFLQEFMSVFGFSKASVWKKNKEEFRLFYSSNESEDPNKIKSVLLALQPLLAKHKVLSVPSPLTHPLDLPFFQETSNGLHFFLALENLGILYLFHESAIQPIDINKWKPIAPLLEKFTKTIFIKKPPSLALTSPTALQFVKRMDFDGIVLFDEKKNRPLLCNAKVLEYLGTDEATFLQSNPLKWSPQYQLNGMLSTSLKGEIFKHLPSNKMHRFEWRIKRTDGTIFDTEVSTFKIPSPNYSLRIFVFRNITKEKKVLADLKASEAQLRLAHKLAKIGTFEYRLADNQATLSEGFCELLNLATTNRKINLETFTQFIQQEEDRIIFKDKIQQAFQTEEGFELEYQISRTDDSSFFAHITVKPKKENGKVTTLFGSLQDISTQHEYNRSIKISQKNLQAAQSLAKIGSSDFDILNNRLIWSKETFNIFGMDPKQGEPSMERYNALLIDEESRKLLEEKMMLAIKAGIPFEIEAQQKKITGEPLYTICTGKPLQKNGQTYKVLGTIQDITTRKLAEKGLESSNRKYNQLFDNMYDAIVVTDKDGVMIDANKSAQKMLGYNLKELNELTIADIVHPEDQEKSKLFLAKLKSEGVYSGYQGRVIKKDGQVVYIQVNSNAIYENGAFAGSRDIVRDITELKKAEEKREQLVSKLELANQELSDFAYVVSHDLKAPLRAITSLSNWLHEDYKDILDKEGEKQLKLLINRSVRMHNFIEGILEYSRIGRIAEEKEWVNLQNLVLEIEDSIEIPTHFDIKIPVPLPPFYGEKVRLNQIFQNLIFNAITYNDKEKGEITISWADQGSHFSFAIKDNGPGIAPEYHEKIFKIFQTLQSRDHIESTGIGLTIVKRIVNQYEGQIIVHSVPKQSTTFEFTLKKGNFNMV